MEGWAALRNAAWAEDAVELFFLQIQGSGQLALPSGERLRLGYGDHNGHPYRSLGRALIQRGELTLPEIVEGIDAVSSRGRAVINLSLGGGFYSPDVQKALMRAIARGCFVVASVGNERPIVTFMARPAGEPQRPLELATAGVARWVWESRYGPMLDRKSVV